MADTLVFSLEDSLPSLTTWLARWDPQQGAEVLAETPLDVSGDLILTEATTTAGDRWYVTGDLPELPASGSLYVIGEVAASGSVFFGIPPGTVPGPNSTKFLNANAFDAGGSGGNLGVNGAWLWTGLHPELGNVTRSLDLYDGLAPGALTPGRHVYRLTWRPNFMEFAVDGVVVSATYEESGGGVPFAIPITQIQLGWDLSELAYWANPTDDPNGHVAAEAAYLGTEVPEPEPNPIVDDVPLNGLALDFNPRTQPGPGKQELLEITASGRAFWAGYDNPVTAEISVNEDGFRTAKFSQTFASKETATGVDPTTWVYAFKSQADLGGTNLGRHAASLYIYGPRGDEGITWTSGSSPAGGSSFLSPNGELTVLIGVLDGGTASWYANGALQATGPMNGYLPAETPSFLGSGETFRALFYDRALTSTQVAEMTALLTAMYTPKRKVTWEAPPSTAPIQLYVISRLLPSGAVETVEVAPTVLELEVGAGETVLVSARSEHGTSSPVQVVS